MKKMTATCTWVLAAVLATGALLALADTSYAARGRDRDRSPTRSTRDGDRKKDADRFRDHRDREADRDRDHKDRDRDRSRIWRGRPWDRYDRDCHLRRPPISQVRVYLIPARVVATVGIPARVYYVYLGFCARW